MLDNKPSTFFGPGYSVVPVGEPLIQLAIEGNADPLLEQLTPAEAHSETGKATEVYFALIEMLYQKYRAQVEATPSNTPKTLTVFRNTTEAPDGTLTRNYTFQVQLTPGNLNTAPET